jgi:ribose 5-phosphate isomerase B
MKIYIASDHAGYDLKETLKDYLGLLKYEVEDFGPFVFDANDDYPDFMKLVAEAVSRNPMGSRGIVIGGSGQGEAIVCNRVKGVRAGVFYGGNIELVKLMREHNDANVLSLGARFVEHEEAEKAVKIFLETKFTNEERHIRRIRKID